MVNRVSVKSLAMLLGSVVLAACVSPPVDPTAETQYCHKRRGLTKVCTSEKVPSLERDAEAKEFRPAPDMLTLYVVRYWGDSYHSLPIQVDGGAEMETFPDSFVRIRLKPGNHLLSFKVDQQTHERKVTGAAGEVRLLGITGAEWFWGKSSHDWSNESEDAIKNRARKSRLIRDVTLP